MLGSTGTDRPSPMPPKNEEADTPYEKIPDQNIHSMMEKHRDDDRDSVPQTVKDGDEEISP